MIRREAVFVTGASSGIGAATVARLARDGYAVFAGVRSELDARRAERIDGVRALRADVTDVVAVAAAADSVRASGLLLRGVVSNAGVVIAGPLEYLPLEELRRQLDVNVIGAFGVVQAFLPLLRAARGRAVFVGSVSGRVAVPFIAPYGASKAALRALASALRVELAPAGIDVVLVEPGSVRTPIWRKGRERADHLRAQIGNEGVRAYGAIVDAMVEQTKDEEIGGMPAERVAAAVARALVSRRPEPEMLVGTDARAGSILAMLPVRLRDALLVRSLRLPARDRTSAEG